MQEDRNEMEMDREERRRLRKERQAKRRRRLDLRLSRRLVSGLFLFWLLISLFLLVFPRSKVSNIEKRELTKFPALSLNSWFSGEFTDGVMTWYTDTVPFRDAFKNANNNLKSLFGISSGNTAEVIGNVKKVSDESPAEEKTETASASAGKTASSGSDASIPASSDAAASAAAAVSSAAAEEEETRDYHQENAEGTFENGFVIVNLDGHWRGLPLFAGGECENYISFMNELYDQIGDTVKIYSMPVPLASEYYLPANYSEYSVPQGETFKKVWSKLNEGIIKVDVTEVLDQHKEEDIYLRTDHHWSALGAYYSAQKLAEAAGVPYAALDSYNEQSVDGYVGSLYGYTQSSNLLNDPEVFTWYEPVPAVEADHYDISFNYQYTDGLLIETDVPNSYLRFMGSDDQIIKVRTSVKNGRKLLMLKDSYGNAEIPFLTGSFEEIWVIDQRYFARNLPDFIRAMGITDFVFSCDSDTVGNQVVTSLDQLMTQDAGSAIIDDAPSAGSGTQDGTAGQDVYPDQEASGEQETGAAQI